MNSSNWHWTHMLRPNLYLCSVLTFLLICCIFWIETTCRFCYQYSFIPSCHVTVEVTRTRIKPSWSSRNRGHWNCVHVTDIFALISQNIINMTKMLPLTVLQLALCMDLSSFDLTEFYSFLHLLLQYNHHHHHQSEMWSLGTGSKFHTTWFKSKLWLDVKHLSKLFKKQTLRCSLPPPEGPMFRTVSAVRCKQHDLGGSFSIQLLLYRNIFPSWNSISLLLRSEVALYSPIFKWFFLTEINWSSSVSLIDKNNGGGGLLWR